MMYANNKTYFLCRAWLLNNVHITFSYLRDTMFITVFTSEFSSSHFQRRYVHKFNEITHLSALQGGHIFSVATAPCNVDHHANDKSVEHNVKKKPHVFFNLDL